MVLGNQRDQHLKKLFLANYAYWWQFFCSSIRVYARLMLIGRKQLSKVFINTDLWKQTSANNPPNYIKNCCSLKISHFWAHLYFYLCLKCEQSILYVTIYTYIYCFMPLYLIISHKIYHYNEKCKKGQCCMNFSKKSAVPKIDQNKHSYL